MSTCLKFSSKASSCCSTSSLAGEPTVQLVGRREQETLGGLGALGRAELADACAASPSRSWRARSCPRPCCFVDDRRVLLARRAFDQRHVDRLDRLRRLRDRGERVDRRAVAHALLERVLGRAQVAAVAADRRVELEEARGVDDALARRGSCRPRPRRCSAGIVTATVPSPSPWNGWNVALTT